MQIESVYIENFRSIERAEIFFGDITTILGRNGVGKSTLLYALESFYNVGALYSSFDYYNNQVDKSIRIRVTYCNLRPEEESEFGAYVNAGKLTVSKVINQGGARYFGAVAQIPRFAELRQLSAREKRAALKADVDAGVFPKFPSIPTGADDVN
jgi:putative ATP-dependent endonuclease of OLD family